MKLKTEPSRKVLPSLFSDSSDTLITVCSDLKRIKVYFTEAQNGRYIPRSIFTDLSEDSLNQIRRSDAGHLFNPEWMIYGKTGASNNFAKGFFT